MKSMVQNKTDYLVPSRVFFLLLILIITGILLALNYKEDKYIFSKLYDTTGNERQEGPSTESQGFDIYNGIVFQAYNPDCIETFDFKTGRQISVFSADIGHGDCIEFSDIFLDQKDSYPLLFSTSDLTPARVYINQIDTQSSKLVKTLIFPEDLTGFYAGHCTDFEHSVIYTIGYSKNSYTESEDNHMIVCSWDYSDMMESNEDSYSPKLCKTFNIPFILNVQGQNVQNGFIWLISSHYKDPDTKIYILDPEKERIVNTLTNFPEEILHSETEDLKHISDNEFIIHSRSNQYWKATKWVSLLNMLP